MTLSVIAQWPWGKLRDLGRSMNAQGIGGFEPAVIVVTDSRFTERGRSPIDDGRKVYPLTPDSVLAYAGDVVCAQRAIRSAVSLLKRRHGSTRDPALDIGRLFKRTYDEELRRAREGARPRVGPLYVLVGVCLPHPWRGTQVIRYSSVSCFAPIQLLGVEAVGMPEDIQRFLEVVAESDATVWGSGDSIPMKPEEWQMQIVSAAQQVINENRSGTLGGPVQTWMVTANGPAPEVQFSWTRDPMVAVEWHNSNALLSMVKPYRLRSPRSATTPEDGLVTAHVTD
jgi:hypothetical protein